MVARYLKVGVSKSCQISNWSKLRHSTDLQIYAALDARLALQLFALLIREENVNNNKITHGSQVNLIFQGKICAKGVINFYGDGADKRRWGNMYVGKGKCIIKLQEVLMPGIKARFSFEVTNNDLLHQMESYD